MRRIVARIFGGLGNQMFIYANARAIAQRNNIPLVLDIESGFKNDPYQRHWSLDHFNVAYLTANAWESFDYPGGKIVRKSLKGLNRLLDIDNYITEKSQKGFDSHIRDAKIEALTWIEGYWQSPKYFEDISSVIRSDFQLKTPLSFEAGQMLEKINSSNAVCLHARRLRNILVGEDNADIKSLQISYYQEALKQIGERVTNPHLFCFSDAPEWLCENLEIPFPFTLVTFNQAKDEKNYEDFYLMKSCDHFIISNSTYAWWAAWLGQFSEKVVISPALQYWDSKEILLNDWVLV